MRAAHALGSLEAGRASPRPGWAGINTALLACSAAAFIGAVVVFLFGVILTHGVYGSRVAWLLGVVMPLLAVAAGSALTAARFGAESERDPSSDGQYFGNGRADRRSVARTIAVISLILIGAPFVLTGLDLAIYGLIFVGYWFSH